MLQLYSQEILLHCFIHYNMCSILITAQNADFPQGHPLWKMFKCNHDKSSYPCYLKHSSLKLSLGFPEILSLLDLISEKSCLKRTTIKWVQKKFLVKSYEDTFIVCHLPLCVQAKDIFYDFTVI